MCELKFIRHGELLRRKILGVNGKHFRDDSVKSILSLEFIGQIH